MSTIIQHTYILHTVNFAPRVPKRKREGGGKLSQMSKKKKRSHRYPERTKDSDKIQTFNHPHSNHPALTRLSIAQALSYAGGASTHRSEPFNGDNAEEADADGCKESRPIPFLGSPETTAGSDATSILLESTRLVFGAGSV